jgi:hypothetical protein
MITADRPHIPSLLLTHTETHLYEQRQRTALYNLPLVVLVLEGQRAQGARASALHLDVPRLQQRHQRGNALLLAHLVLRGGAEGGAGRRCTQAGRGRHERLLRASHAAAPWVAATEVHGSTLQQGDGKQAPHHIRPAAVLPYQHPATPTRPQRP